MLNKKVWLINFFLLIIVTNGNVTLEPEKVSSVLENLKVSKLQLPSECSENANDIRLFKEVAKKRANFAFVQGLSYGYTKLSQVETIESVEKEGKLLAQNITSGLGARPPTNINLSV